MLSEKTTQDTITISSDSVSVRWKNSILRDGEEISSSYHRKAYTRDQYNELVNEVENGLEICNMLGWTPNNN